MCPLSAISKPSLANLTIFFPGLRELKKVYILFPSKASNT